MEQLTDNLFMTIDDSFIVDLLSDLEIKLDDSKTRSLTFLFSNDFYLVQYFSNEGDKGFCLFKINQVLDNLFELDNLNMYLSELLKLGDNVNLLNLSISQINENRITGKFINIFRKN